MKKTLLIAALLATSAVQANDREADIYATCDRIVKMAHTIMLGRQIGVPMTDMLLVPAGFKNTPKLQRIARDLVRSAYAQPRYEGDEWQSKAAGDFRDETHVKCLNDSLQGK